MRNGIADFSGPVIAAVNGAAATAGFELALACDLIFVARGAKFLDTHARVGIVPGWGLSQRLPRLIGIARAKEVSLSGNALPAERAYRLGLVDELVETPAEALPAALDIARSMLKNSPQAMALSKQAVWGSLERGYADALESAWGLLRLHWSHPDFREGPRAFGEKREPRWNPDPNARVEDEE